MIVFKDKLRNIFKGVVMPVAITIAVFSTTMLHANYGGIKYDNKQIDCISKAAYFEVNKLTLFQTHNNLRFY